MHKRDGKLRKGLKIRKLAVAMGICLWAPVGVYALGMGDISVQSALNEPLKAEIKLLSNNPAELEGLTVQMAPSSAFEKLGVERTPALANLLFEVIKQGRGAPYVKVSSNRAIREPFLDFVVTVNWANGQLLREYTLLLDPPVFDAEEKAMPVEAPTTTAAKIEREKPVVMAPKAQPAAPLSAGSYGPTQRTDTLWTIAKRMRPNDSVGVAQMMIALMKENPDAFYGANVNGLKAGYVLRAPDMAVINEVSKDKAVRETNRQYQEWMANSRGGSTMAGVRQEVASQQGGTAEDGVTTAVSATSPSSTPAANARLKLVTPEDTQAAGGLGGTGKNGKGGSLQKELAIAQESAEAMRQENADLRSRVAELEKQIQSMQRLITLKDDTFTALQGGVTKDAMQEGAAATPPVTEGETAATAPQTAAEQQPKPKPKAAPLPTPEPSMVDQLLADPTRLGLVVGVPLLLILGAVAYIRKRRQNAAEDSIPGGISLDSLVVAKPQAGSAGASASAAASSVAATDFESEMPVLPEYSTTDIGSIHTEEADIDPVAEADVYLAYRRYEQAEALLKEAIRNHPDRSELRLKLMEIYYTTKNKEGFEAQAESLYALVGGKDDQVWAQAADMGREFCPEHPLFAEGDVAAASSPVTSAETNLDATPEGHAEFDMSALEAPAPAMLSDSDLAASLDMNLDLPADLGLDLGGTLAETENAGLGSPLEQRADDLLASFENDTAEAAVPDTTSEWTLESAVSEFGGADLKSEQVEEHVPVKAVEAEHIDVNENLGLEEATLDIGNVAIAGEGTEANQEWNLDQAVSQYGPQEEELESTVFDSSDDVVGTKLDLAKAYIDMGDQSGARTILDEVVEEGNETQRQQAEQLIRQIG